MPWQEQGGGYTTKRGGHVRNVPQYEALRDKGMSRSRAAAITNSHRKRRGPKDDNGASSILVKSEYGPGKFKPITQMGPRRREQVELRVRAGLGRPDPVHNVARHSLKDVYAQHAFGQRGSPQRVAQNLHAKTTPSAVHPNVHYGPSVTPALAAHVDSSINPARSAALKHPIVFHHDHGLHPAAAAGIGAHSTSGNRGHVVLGSAWTRKGAFKSPIEGVKSHEVIAHELEHADVKQRQPVRPLTQHKIIGEEARADAKSKANVYIRNGVIGRKKAIDRVAALSTHARTTLAGDFFGAGGAGRILRRTQLDPQLKAGQHYHEVQRAVRVAALRKGNEMDDSGASQILVLQGPRQPIAKYQRGTITYHQEQANLHSRKRSSGQRQAAAGATVAGVGAAAALHPQRIGVNVRDAFVHPGADLAAHRRAADYGAKAVKIADKGGRAAFLGGAGLAAVGGGRAVYHGVKRNQHAKAAQQARRQRNVTLAKADDHPFSHGQALLNQRERLAREDHNNYHVVGWQKKPETCKFCKLGVKIAKADHHDAAAAFLGGGAAGTGFHAVQYRRRAAGQRAASSSLHEQAQGHYRIAENRMQRHGMPKEAKGRLPMTPTNVHNTQTELFLGRAQDTRAGAHARNAIASGRKAKGRAGAAVLLAGGAAAAASRRDRTPRYGSVGYR